ncbi:MAG: TetR/AcrR family transcriptional regulator, partial [Spirulina sp. SIO3F2]|nr:TetR/AcrR family transcriptional regulator [Spirulina sp. SIO3F2]
MTAKKTKAEQTAQTRRAILDHTRKLFVTHGYAATGTEAMIAALGITRGALYHQFGNKQGVFRAVIAEMFAEISQYVETQVQMVDQPWAQLVRGCQAFLEIAHREDIRRLVFVEAPAVLDVETLTQFDQQHGYGLLCQGVQAVVDAGPWTAAATVRAARRRSVPAGGRVLPRPPS